MAVFVDTIAAETVAATATGSLQDVGININDLADYAPAATSLFNNMKLPAAVVTAGMISLGFATGFPELPRETPQNKHVFTPRLRERCDALKRLHIVVALIAVTSELIVVMWAAVEVNQLTEKKFALAASVWDLIERDCDLAWSAVNSHFVMGIIGFVAMLTLRAYVMLLAAMASNELMIGAGTGTGAALCLMISIVNRGVESGGGNGERYGSTILDLLQHYVVLLARSSVNETSPGPLQFTTIVLESVSLLFMANVLLFQNGKATYDIDGVDADVDLDGGSLDLDGVADLIGTGSATTKHNDEDDDDDNECPVVTIDVLELEPAARTAGTGAAASSIPTASGVSNSNTNTNEYDTVATAAVLGSTGSKSTSMFVVVDMVDETATNNNGNTSSNNNNSNAIAQQLLQTAKTQTQTGTTTTTRTATKEERKQLAKRLAMEEEQEDRLEKQQQQQKKQQQQQQQDEEDEEERRRQDS
eukprot:CAMPEP_0168223994 /NCGR_PEP_ID=MMETSP0140_2-20121125/11744_1 /TAXON_ID=44445 /ORGANISM="Pseudo-nitzschia australis, Strain 10249 10 AB" /LENGTH=474 /DNA_ID=CAMNT_0008154187 /DNA_START=467 /DNA_END=1887 /DNA_ORIENTATION=+